MNQKISYFKPYKGVNIEATNTNFEKQDHWAFYLYLAVECFDESLRDDLCKPVRVLDYGTRMQLSPDCLQNLEWHHGITFYSLTSDTEVPFTIIKAGCDYSHLWDTGCLYDSDSVIRDAERCVDSLLLQFPDLKLPQQLWDEYYKPFNDKMEAKKALGLGE